MCVVWVDEFPLEDLEEVAVNHCEWHVRRLWVWVKNTGYPKTPSLVKGKMDPTTCGLEGFSF